MRYSKTSNNQAASHQVPLTHPTHPTHSAQTLSTGDLAAAASFTNGVGSLGPIAQGMAAGLILQYSWPAIFVSLGAILLLASCALGLAQLSEVSARNKSEQCHKKDE